MTNLEWQERAQQLLDELEDLVPEGAVGNPDKDNEIVAKALTAAYHKGFRECRLRTRNTLNEVILAMRKSLVELPERARKVRVPRTVVEKFLELVDKSAGTDACWIWKGSCTDDGYGRFSSKLTEEVSAHRNSYTLFVGRIPEGKHVLHSCDNPPCVNPKHLWLGTQVDNNEDCRAKGRAYCPPPMATGDANPNSKLNEEKRTMCDLLFTEGFNNAEIARLLMLQNSTIRSYRLGRSHRKN